MPYNRINMRSKLKKIKNIIHVLCILLIIIAPNTSNAQKRYNADDISADIFPKIPGPLESVDIKLTSYSFNLNNYYITWFRNGEEIVSGFGEREITFTTGKTGEITGITALIDYENQIIRKEFQFAPSQVDLLWEVSDAYTPPFYKGKPLPIKQSDIKITAIPETLLIEPSDAPNLIYYWDRNYSRQVSDSGFGKQSLEITADPLGVEEKITVTTNDRRENSFATHTIDIPTDTHQTDVLFYEIDNEGRVMTNKALNTHGVVDGTEIRFGFFPLNISSIKKNFVDLFVGWNINGSEIAPQDFDKQNELYISSGGQSGTTTIGLVLEGIEKLLQTSNTNIDIIFTN